MRYNKLDKKKMFIISDTIKQLYEDLETENSDLLEEFHDWIVLCSSDERTDYFLNKED